MLLELLKREKQSRIIPDEDLDIFIKASSYLVCVCVCACACALGMCVHVCTSGCVQRAGLCSDNKVLSLFRHQHLENKRQIWQWSSMKVQNIINFLLVVANKDYIARPLLVKFFHNSILQFIKLAIIVFFAILAILPFEIPSALSHSKKQCKKDFTQ